MKCKELVNKICELIEENESNTLNFQKITQRQLTDNDPMFHNAEMELKEFQNRNSEIIQSHIINLQTKCNELNFQFFDIPSDIYIQTYESRLKNYLTEFSESIEKDFIEREIKIFQDPVEYRIFDFMWEHGTSIGYHNFIKDNINFEFSRKRKLEFLKNSLQNINYVKKEDNSKKVIQLTANQIVLLLDKIGFFTHEKIENISKVKQAGLISLITGIHNKTIKNNIQKLDKSPSVNGNNYKEDIDKIDKILDDLT